MKQVKLITLLSIGVITLSLTASTVLAVDNSDNAGSASGVSSEMPVSSQNSSDIIESSLVQLRKDKEDFLKNKETERIEAQNAVKEKIASRRKAIQAKIDAAKSAKEAKRKAVLTRLLDIQIKQLKNTKDRVAKMKSIKEELKTQLNTSIDSAVVALEAKKSEVVAATTADQLKQLAKDIKDLLKAKRDIVKKIVDAILASKTNSAVDAAEALLAKMSSRIANLKAAGQNTAELEKLLAAAQSKVASANTKSGKEDFKGAIKDLKDAYNNLKRAIEKAEGQSESSSLPTSTAEPTDASATPTPAS